MPARKFLGALNVSGTETFDIYQSAEIVIVDEDKVFKFVSIQIVMTSLQRLNNGQEFLMESLVANFSPNHLPKKKATSAIAQNQQLTS